MLPPPTSCLPAKDLGVFLGPAAGYTPPRNVFCASATDVEYGSMQALIIPGELRQVHTSPQHREQARGAKTSAHKHCYTEGRPGEMREVHTSPAT